ncbi:unnamed protein product [Cylicocyclus nassatus]|uniref:2-(3-amino-3-carboxypropyl)histidine synthase subunit 2 n=1 Tax=Cylicocyclus nassatus TaxID=53992 RepID=A0AA36HAQ9_CYLNA|nr:unnamed protein product [Cylicocyclus nassatus]
MTDDVGPSTAQFFTTHTPSDHPKDADPVDKEIASLVKDFSDDELRKFFSLEDTIQWIITNSYRRVALQLPDQCLSRACRIAKLIESHTNAKTFVLADTSYRSCCVDEVAAAHASCDAIVHYGDACLSALTEKIPVKFVFGSFPVDITAFEGVMPYLSCTKDRPVLLLTDACYSDSMAALEEAVERCLPSTQIYRAAVVDPTQEIAHDVLNNTLSFGRIMPRELCEASSVFLCFVGGTTSPLLSLWLMTYPQCESVIVFDPQTSAIQQQSSHSLRQLRKRLFLIEKLRDAHTVGLVVGTVGVRGHIEAVQRVRKLCKAAGKRLYVISVGKINVPKLSNFAEIDAFILLSCPFGIILDSSDYFRPILSMFEAEMALNPSKSWSGYDKWSADFTSFTNDEVGCLDGDHTDVSLVTGRIRAGPAADSEAKNSGEILPYEKGDYFKSRTWRGLDADVRLDESTKVEEGRTGTALSYDTEPPTLKE